MLNPSQNRDVILSVAAFQAERRACPEPHGEGISRGTKLKVSCLMTLLGLIPICLILVFAQVMSAQTAMACHPMDTREPSLPKSCLLPRN